MHASVIELWSSLCSMYVVMLPSRRFQNVSEITVVKLVNHKI